MADPAVNIILRIDDSKTAADAKKANDAILKAVKDFHGFAVMKEIAKGVAFAVGTITSGVEHLASQTGATQRTASAFDKLDKSIMSAADQSGALKRGLGVVEGAARDLTKYFNSEDGKKAINGFFQFIVFGAGLAIEKLADMSKAVRHPVDFIERHLSKWGNFFGANSKFVEQIKDGDWFDQLIAKTREVGTALKTSVLAGESTVKPTFVDKKAVDEQRKLLVEFQQAQELYRKMYIAERSKDFELQREAAEAQGKLKDQVRAQDDARAAERVEQIIKANDAEAAAISRGIEQKSGLIGAAQAVGSAISDAIVSGAMAAGEGGEVGKAIAKSLNGAVMALGANLIAAGLYVMVGATLALFVPGLAAMFPPVAIPIAAGAIALGTAMVAGSSYLGGLMSGGAPSAGGGGRGVPAIGGGAGGRASGGTRSSAASSGFQGDGQSAPPVQIVENYNFNGPMGGSPRRIARSMMDLQAEEDTIGPRRGRGRR